MLTQMQTEICFYIAFGFRNPITLIILKQKDKMKIENVNSFLYDNVKINRM